MMVIELTPRAEDLLHQLMAQYPDKTPRQILEEALRAWFERELGRPVTGPLVEDLR